MLRLYIWRFSQNESSLRILRTRDLVLRSSKRRVTVLARQLARSQACRFAHRLANFRKVHRRESSSGANKSATRSFLLRHVYFRKARLPRAVLSRSVSSCLISHLNLSMRSVLVPASVLRAWARATSSASALEAAPRAGARAELSCRWTPSATRAARRFGVRRRGAIACQRA